MWLSILEFHVTPLTLLLDRALGLRLVGMILQIANLPSNLPSEPSSWGKGLSEWCEGRGGRGMWWRIGVFMAHRACLDGNIFLLPRFCLGQPMLSEPSSAGGHLGLRTPAVSVAAH